MTKSTAVVIDLKLRYPFWTLVGRHGIMSHGVSDGEETEEKESAIEPRSEATDAPWTNIVCDHGGYDDPHNGDPIGELVIR